MANSLDNHASPADELTGEVMRSMDGEDDNVGGRGGEGRGGRVEEEARMEVIACIAHVIPAARLLVEVWRKASR